MDRMLTFLRGGGKVDRIHNRVSEILGRKRMKITDLRDEAQIAYGTAYALFSGKAKGIQFDTLAKLCRALDVEVGELFEFVPNGEKDGDA